MKSHISRLKTKWVLAIYIIMAACSLALTQTPTVTVRFANPQFDCLNDQYCVDVEFLSDLPDIQVFGMNVRFFYDDDILELISFSDYQGGYGPVSPDPPIVTTNGPAGPALFNFTGPAEFINGAIQLLDTTGAITLDTVIWTKLFQICFTVDDTNPDVESFCPPIVWDLEQNPANGGFLTGDDGVVITVVDPDPNNESTPATENVVQFNWEYIGPGTPPFGQPVEIVCTSINCTGELSVLKTDSLLIGDCLEPGDSILYEITIINEGIVTISNVTVSDPGTIGLECIPAVPFSIDPGDTIICTAVHVLTQGNINAGSYSNIATVSGINLDSVMVSDNSDDPADTTDIDPNADGNPDDPTVTLLPFPELSVTKIDILDLGANGTLEPGDVILYFITVTNTGNQLISNITLSDPNATGLACIPATPFSLATGASVSCSASHIVTQPDIDAGFYENSATATGQNPAGDPVSDVSDDPDDLTDIDPNGDCNPDDPTVTLLVPTPILIVRFSNPHFNCLNEEYCLDVEFMSDTDSLELFGMNVRFFYDDDILELIDFRDYQGGYGPVSPDPPIVSTSAFAGPAFFNFGGPADFVNGAIQLTDDTQEPIYLSTTGWTKIFQICFMVDDTLADIDTFCPPVVWDLEVNPEDGGFLIGDDGVVLTIVDPDSILMSVPVTENVVQFNWQYSGPGTPPYGEPIELVCTSINCFPMLTCAADITIECDDSTDPSFTGFATSSDNCEGDSTITFTDSITLGSCPQSYSITRTWIVINECDLSDTCIQLITVVDTTAPVLTCPADTIIDCTASTSPDSTGIASATDNCDTLPEITFSDVSVGGSCPQNYTITRTWVATDSCGNSSSCVQIISIVDTIPPTFDPACQLVFEFFTSNGSTCPAASTISLVVGQFVAESEGWSVGNNPIPSLNGCLFDNCSNPDSLLARVDSIAITGDDCDRTITVFFTIIDQCGNESVAQFICVVIIHDDVPPTITCPPDITIDCEISTSPDSTGFATATDDCQVVAITFSDSITPGACPQELFITRTWTADDSCGNVSTCIQNITVQDTTPPTFDPACQLVFDFFTSLGSTCPAASDISLVVGQFVGESEGWTVGNNLIPSLNGCLFDNCSNPDSLLARVDSIAITGDSCDRTITVFFTIIDQCGNESVDQFVCVVNIHDDVPPTITCPADLTVECDDSTSPDSTGFATATDDCQTGVGIAFVDTITAGSCPQELIISRTWTADDSCGNLSTCVQIITVVDTTPPSIVCPSDVTIECDADTSTDSNGFATATDNCDTAAVITSLDSIIPGTCPQEYTILRTFTATDACGNSSTCLQTLVVQDNTPPVITCPVDLTLACIDTIPSDTATATDNCSSVITYSYADIMCDNPVMGFTDIYDFSNWSTILPPEGGSVTPMGDSEVMLVSPDVTVSCNGASVLFQIVIPSTGELVFDWNYTTLDQDGPLFDPFGYNLNGTFFQLTDNGGPDAQSGTTSVSVTAGDVFAFEQQSADCILGAGATTVVEFFACIGDTGDVCTSLIIRTHTAADECGNEASCVQTIFVVDSIAPTITCPANITIECTDSTLPDSTGFATAIDNCDTLPTITFADVTIAGSCPQERTITRTWSATDNCGNSSTCVQIIVVDDSTAPILTCPANITVECTASTAPANTGLATATDNCDAVPTITFGDVTVGGTCPQERTITRTWSATDDCGNTGTCVQIIFVDDSTPPLITCPPNITVECTASTAPATTGSATATDLCDAIPTITFSDVTVGGSCPQERTITRTWLATDDCGNSSTCAQTIFVDDSTAPAITCPINVTIECTASTAPASTGTATATDLCDGTPTITFGDVTVAGACPQERTINRTWIATDDCGNSSTCLQVILVDDSTPPSITCPANTTVSCANMVPPINTAGVTSSDNCGPVTVTHVVDVTTNQTCVNRFTLTRVYRSTDACGNSATCSQIITVFDNTAPTLTCPANTTVSCANMVPPVNTSSVTTSDNCSGVVTVTHLGDVTTNQTCANRFTLTRTYRAMDECGNSASCTQVITVFDNTPPAITCPANITIDFGDNTTPANTGTPTGTDNCGGTPTFTNSDVTVAGLCTEQFTINRTWTATDACGNTATCLQVIEVQGSCLLDLSLTKVYIDLGPVNGGDDVNFTITVTNEGLVTVGAVIITDYIPIGFSLNDPDWTPGTSGSTGQSASIELSIANGGLDANGLNPGESVSVNITLQADLDIQPGFYVNTAEISFVYDLDGDDVSANDVDSDPDEDDTNDPAGEDDIDMAFICVLPQPVIVGDAYVCPDELVVYSVDNFNPNFTYIWTLSGGGVITQDNGSDIEVQWQTQPGGPFTITLTVIGGPNCQATAFLSVFIQGIETVTCNDLIQISLGPDCEAVVNSSMILEGENEDNNNYFVVITDQFGNVIPNATFTGEHAGQCFMVSVQNICNDQSCWGTICVEDKLPPDITCSDAIVPCGTPLDPVFTPPVTGSISQNVISGLSIGPNAGTVTSQPIDLVLPSNALVTDVNVTVDLTHTWSGDLLVELISPSGTAIILANAVCGSADNWENVTFDDQASTPVSLACNVTPPPALLQGFVIPEEALSTFNNEFADGTWTLQITDLADADGGVLNEVTLDVAYVESLPYAPTASDACGEVTLTFTESETGETCDTLTITRIWTATDESGNTATCVQTIEVLPLDLGDVLFPGNFIGQCGESTSPEITGWPTLNGQEITDENALCNIFLGYWDKELAECGGGRKIVRTWTVLDWCTVELVEGVQVIKLMDTEPPVLTCPPDFEVGTDFWYCYANVSVPKPTASDACSDIATYVLTSSGGEVVAYGDNYVINGLLIGTYTLTWTVTDECGNSSTCSFEVTVADNVVPVANCDQHTIVALSNDGPYGVTLVPASVFDDGSYDNCGPVTFRARRMDSCIDFDWTTEGACIDDTPGGIPPVNSRDRGTVHRPCVPFACCDVGAGPVMVELEVTDASGNVNYCMIEAEVQDKVSPFVECPPDIIVSCDFWFPVEEGTFNDAEGNNDGSLDEDPLTPLFGNMYDAFRYQESVRKNIIINDPGNEDYFQPHNWGLDGWADDNCEVNLQVRVRIIDDCSGGDLPGNAPQNAVKLIERRFSATDGSGISPGTCTQRIWVVDFNPFYITDQDCNNSNSQDGVIWPCDVVLTTCPDSLTGTGEPIVFDDACSLIGIAYEDTRFDFVDGACFKILREWSVIDWCQYDPQTGDGLWHYIQVIKVHDHDGPVFQDCPSGPVTLCVADTGVTLPDNNQAFLGEDNPLASSCSVHLNLTQTVYESCSDVVLFDVKIYPFNGTDYWQVKQNGSAVVDDQNNAVLSFNTRESLIPFVRNDGIPYNSPWCGEYHRILWSAQDGCGNWSTCEYLFRLEDCKQPSPVCINGLSTVVMPIGGQVTIWAKDFNASSFDDCTPAANLLYSFSGDAYEPSFTYTCDNVPAFGVELVEEIWVADGGVDHNCNGVIEWSERNKDYCTTTIVITDNNDVCGGSGSILAGDITTDQLQSVEKVNVNLTSPGHFFPTYVTTTNGKYNFHNLAGGLDYMITPERKDDPKNGVSTLDLVRIQKHLLGKELFTSPYQYIAADANNNRQVSAIDLVEIRKLILGIYNEYPSNTSWRFVDKGFAMNPAHPWPFNEQIEIAALSLDSIVHNDFIAVKVGDVNHTAKANLTQIQPRDGRRIMNINVSVSGEAEAGKMVEMKLTFPEKVSGFQWTMETKGVEFAGISSESMMIDQENVGLIGDGIVTMSWNGDLVADAPADGPITMVIRWKVIESGAVNSMVKLTSLVTAAEAYTPEEEILDVKLKYEDNVEALDFALYQNKPNPWNAQTSIGFDLPEDGDAVMTVFDVTGKEILRVEGEYKAGYNVINVLSKDLPDTGIMYYRLDSGEYSASKKMVRLH